MYDQGWNWNRPYTNGMQQFNTTTQFPPRYEIVKVNGQAGARAFQMAPNSSLFLADSTNPNLIWLVQTDGAGYLSTTPLDVTIHQNKPQPDYSTLEERIRYLEEKYEQLNSGFSKSTKKQRVQQPATVEQSADATT